MSYVRLIKAAPNKRRITGWASTPKPDLLFDVVEPMGAEFKLPLPLLRQHDHAQPIGRVLQLEKSAKGLRMVAEVAEGIPESDAEWQRIAAGLVTGLSIGFRSLELTPNKSGGVLFKRITVLEVSTVSIPANSDCRIEVAA